MRRKLTILVLVAVAVLAAAGVAEAANGGFTPVTPHSPNAHHINTAYDVILGFTGAIFLLVEGALVTFIVKYRRGKRPRTADGAQVHGNTRLELIWTVVPVLILAAIGVVVFLELPKISNAPAASNPIHITVEGHQFYWQFDYPNGARTIGALYVPVDRVVDLKVVSADVIHSWWIPALGGKIQAIPGRTNHTWFEANDPGTYTGQCAELCGVYHAAMSARVVAESTAAYLHDTSVSVATGNLGRAEFTGVCATCHGMTGQGGYGPNIANNSLLTQKAGLSALITKGLGLMPPVAISWTPVQYDALAAYVKSHVFKGASASGG